MAQRTIVPCNVELGEFDLNNRSSISQQIAENERQYKSKNRLSWIFCWCTVVSLIAVPILCGLADLSSNAIFTISLLSFFGFWTLGIIFHSIAKKHKKEIQRLQAQQQQLDIQNNIAPIIVTPCKHYNGLPIATNSACRLTIFQDMIYFNSGSMEFKIPMDRVISMDIATKSQVEYIQKQSLSRAVAGGLLFGDVGVLLGGMPKSRAVERTESFLVITYNKGELIQFITLSEADCNKVISAVSQYVQFQRKSIEL